MDIHCIFMLFLYTPRALYCLFYVTFLYSDIPCTILYPSNSSVYISTIQQKTRMIIIRVFQNRPSACTSSFGGDEENRTPVRKHCSTGLSERSLCFDLESQALTNKLHWSDLDTFSRSGLRELAFRYPAIGLFSAHAGDKQKEVSIKLLKRNLR